MPGHLFVESTGASQGTNEVVRELVLGALNLPSTQPYALTLVLLLLFKGVKVLTHTFSYYFLTLPAQPSKNPTYTSLDVTVIVPTIGDMDDEFVECIESILANGVGMLIVATVGAEKFQQAQEVCNKISEQIMVVSTQMPNKREQFLHASELVTTPITCYADDHVFLPRTFFNSALAPFEDPLTGIVGTTKRVRRDRSGGFVASLLNYIACIYLERHNFECMATYNLDGGVFVISGRAALVRTDIIQSAGYRHGFLNETWFFGQVGPLKVDDDNFTTRYMVNQGYRTVFHAAPAARIETTLGTMSAGGITKLRGQLLRWVRTTWRSNATSLLADRTCYERHPWTTYAMFLSSLVNFALFYDGALCWTLWRAGLGRYMPALVAFILATKLIKPLPHLWREPRDWLLVPAGIAFGYLHSLVKLWAFFTARNIGWTGRKGIDPVDK